MKNVLSKFFRYFFMAFLIVIMMPFFTVPMTAKAAPKAHTAHKGHSAHDGWKAINNVSQLIDLGKNGGSGYLTANIVLSNNYLEIKNANTVNLCLNGYNLIQKYNNEPIETISVGSDSKLTIYDESGNTGTITHRVGYKGAGVKVNNGKLVMNGGKITNNSNDGFGGGIILENESVFEMNGGSITNNSANHGGGVYVEGNSEIILNEGNISNNTSSKYGGAIFSWYGHFTMNGGSISNNSASEHGGAIYAYETDINIINGTISKNIATRAGGGLLLESSEMTMSGGSISDNKASSGGGISTSEVEVEISGGTISGNEAELDGGGIDAYEGSIVLSGGTITGNTANDTGGGVFTQESYFIMKNGTISENKASSAAGCFLDYYDEYNYSGFDISGGLIKDNKATDGSDGIVIREKGILTDGICEDQNVFYGEISYVRFNPNKGKGNAYTQFYKLTSKAKLTDNRFTRSGYKFYNWNTKANGSGTSYAAGAEVSKKPFELYAQWAPTKYTVTFDANGGSGTMATQTIKFNTSTALTKNAFTKKGFTFTGWNTKADGSGTSYADASKVKLKVLNTNKITLYAQWKSVKASYTVEHYRQKVDGSYPAAANDTESFTGKINASVTPEVKTYKGFTSPATQTAKIKADGSLVIKYYYTRNSYKLTWDFAGGKASGTYTKGTVKYGAKITAPVPVREGYVFNGWDKTVPAKMPANDVTYKAKWRKLTQEEQVRSFVGRFYTIILERPAEEAGLNDWTGRLLRKEATGAQVAAGFINSDEFQKKKMTDEEYVTKLYRAFFDREPDQAGYEGWLRELKNGKSRDYVLRGFIGSPEFDNLCKKYGINAGSY